MRPLIQQAALQTELAAQHLNTLGTALEAHGARLAAEHAIVLQVCEATWPACRP